MTTRCSRAAISIAAALLGCGGSEEPASTQPASGTSDPQTQMRRAALASLRGYEESKRAATDFASPKSWDEVSGPDPFDVVDLGAGYVVALRGRDALISVDAQGREVARVSTPPLPTDVVVADDGELIVVGEGTNVIASFGVGPDGQGFAPGPTWSVDGSDSLRAAALVPGGPLLVADRHRGRLVAVELNDAGGALEPGLEWGCPGATEVHVAGDLVAANCVLAHKVLILRLGDDRWPRAVPARTIEHDGPMWSTALLADPPVLLAGGVENRPLDRSDGAFGYVDSFLFVYALEAGAAKAVHTINVSEHGVITPKALQARRRDGALEVLVTGYGSDVFAAVRLPERGEPIVKVNPAPPGIRAVAGGLAVSPLLDRLVLLAQPARTVPIAGEAYDRPQAVRVGEALFFTKLMAPWNEAAGRRSRFTCETCHFEGTVDGRTHYTGRGDVHATTKTLFGLGSNRPHFSRALDRSMSQMVNNEFRVAGRGNEYDPWFSVGTEEFPWLVDLGVQADELGPIDLRRSLIAFLFAFVPSPNPTARNRQAFDDVESRGAELFAEHCESCHQARLVADDPSSRAPFEQWEELTLRHGGPIVWGTEQRVRTGVEPYVHPEGARNVSLRRLYVKRPLLTDGGAADVDAVLEQIALADGEFKHRDEAAPEGERLPADERAALAAFLDLL